MFVSFLLVCKTHRTRFFTSRAVYYLIVLIVYHIWISPWIFIYDFSTEFLGVTFLFTHFIICCFCFSVTLALQRYFFYNVNHLFLFNFFFVSSPFFIFVMLLILFLIMSLLPNINADWNLSLEVPFVLGLEINIYV